MSRPGGGRRAVVAVFVAVLLASGAVFLQYAIDGSRPAAAGWDESSPFDAARSVLDLLGGVRQSLAANLWSKTDTVFHEYLHSVDNEHALFPYYWLITRLDPHFTMAYYFASWMLARLGWVDQGFDLAVEGLRYNPDSPALQQNMAELYLFYRKDPVRARGHILKAMELSGSEADRQVYETFLAIVEKVLAGEKEIPEPVPMQQAHEDDERHHDHRHDQGGAVNL